MNAVMCMHAYTHTGMELFDNLDSLFQILQALNYWERPIKVAWLSAEDKTNNR